MEKNSVIGCILSTGWDSQHIVFVTRLKPLTKLYLFKICDSLPQLKKQSQHPPYFHHQICLPHLQTFLLPQHGSSLHPDCPLSPSPHPTQPLNPALHHFLILPQASFLLLLRHSWSSLRYQPSIFVLLSTQPSLQQQPLRSYRKLHLFPTHQPQLSLQQPEPLRFLPQQPRTIFLPQQPLTPFLLQQLRLYLPTLILFLLPSPHVCLP